MQSNRTLTLTLSLWQRERETNRYHSVQITEP
jgi:hypothetical protein